MPGQLLLVRHAQSEWNALGRWQGHADPPLSDDGRRQVAAAAKQISSARWYGGFDLIVSSDLARARQTAELLADDLRLDAHSLVEAGLREYDAGQWSGLTLAEIESRWPGEVERFTRGLVSSPPGGENRTAFDARVQEAARRLAASAARSGAHSVLVVAHGGVVNSFARSAGLARHHIGHLAGYRGWYDERGLFPGEMIDLLGAPELAADSA